MQKSPFLFALFLLALHTYTNAQTDSIRHLGTVDLVAAGFDICVQKSHLYALLGNQSMQVYDITNPKRAKNVGRVRKDHVFSSSIDIHEGYLFLYGFPYGKFTLFDLEKPATPKEVGHVVLPGFSPLWRAAHTKNYSYLTSNDTLYVVNTTNKSKPYIETKPPCNQIAGVC